MATYIDEINGKNDSDNTEVSISKPTFKVSVTFDEVDGENPLAVAKSIAEWLKEGATTMIYDVVNEVTNEQYSVDLSEDDEDAVLKIETSTE